MLYIYLLICIFVTVNTWKTQSLYVINTRSMKKLLLTLLAVPLLVSCQDSHLIEAKIAQSPKTFCNPVNLNYRFMKIDGGEGIREAADPVVVTFKEKHYLFPVSKIIRIPVTR